jgi:hypothetical protein
MLSPSPYSLPQPAADPTRLRILCVLSDSFFRVAQVIDQVEPKSEPEQVAVNTLLTEAQKSEPEQIIENKGSCLSQIFY